MVRWAQLMETSQVTSKKHKLSKEQHRALEALFDVKYVDGKPVKVKVDPLKELRDELEPEEDANPFDATKRALYADQPKAKQKMDRSITARDLNMTLESFNRRRNEARFELARLKMPNAPYCAIFSKDRQWTFQWNFKDATISTMKRPDNGYELTWKNPKFSKFDENLLPEIYKKLSEHINRVKS